MGDVLHALPAISALRAEHADVFLGWAVEPSWAPLLASAGARERGSQMPVVDRVHAAPFKQWARDPFAAETFRGIRSIRRELKEMQYDVCLDMQGSLRSAWLGMGAGAARRMGEKRPRESLSRLFFNEKIPTNGTHVIEQDLELASAIFGERLPYRQPKFPRDEEAEAAAKAMLENAKAQTGAQRFAFVTPGAGWGAKRWPVERYASVARFLREMGVGTLVNSAPGEEDLAEAVVAASSRNDAPVAAVRVAASIAELIAWLPQVCLAIGGDTGPMHLASALGVPVVGLYGPTDPARNGPYETGSRVLRHPQSKRDHSRRSETEWGLLTITPEEVTEAAVSLLRENSPSGSADFGRQDSGPPA